MTAPTSLPSVGDSYTVQSLIGAGGMGRVYDATDVRHGRRVALKVLDPGLTSELGAARFLREVSIVAKLVHPNIVPLHDSGEANGQLYYVMPCIEGGSLRERLRMEIQLPLDRVLRWAAELTDALAYAHASGFVHCDIKPENILLQAGHAMVADFGIARALDLAAADHVTSHAITLGTPAYMSPEQATGEERLDGRTDIYSLACVIYELLVGEPPFVGPTPQHITARKLAGEYSPLSTVRPTVPASLERALARALSPSPADRFATAEEFGRALAASTRPSRRWIAVAALSVGLIGLGSFWLVTSRTKPRPLAAANRVVVSLFENRTGEPRFDQLGFMAADWVTDGLQRTGVLDVVPTATALAASEYVRGRANLDPVRALAAETTARYVITGSLYREGDRLVIRAQLTDGVSGQVVGAVAPIRATEGEPGESLNLLRARLMGLLALRLDERVGLSAAQSNQPPLFVAYQSFSEAMDAYIRNDYSPARVAFKRANRLDTTFVLPLLYVALCYNNEARFAEADSVYRVLAMHRDELSMLDRLWLDYGQAQLRGDQAGALAAIRQAAVLAPGTKAAYNFAVQALQSRQAFAAESALRRLSPDRGAMRGWMPYWETLTNVLHVQGKHDAELLAARTARRGSPYRIAGYVFEMRALAAQDAPAEMKLLLAEAERRASPTSAELGGLAFEAARELWAHGDSVQGRAFLNRAHAYLMRDTGPDSVRVQWIRAQVAAQGGDWKEALRLGERLVAREPAQTNYRGAVGVALARLGERVRAREVLDGLARDQRTYPVGFAQFEAARIAAALGERAEAQRLIEEAFARGYSFNLNPHRDLVLGDLRAHPLLGPSDAFRR